MDTVASLTLIVLLVLALFAAQISVIVTVNNEDDDATSEANQKSKPARFQKAPLGDNDKDLLIFIQITDLHLSVYSEKQRFQQLKEFCTTNLPAINPKLVLATGDLTDAKTLDNLGSMQHETEWKMYSEILTSCGAMKTVQWLDIKGNHDNFNVNGYNSPDNYFRQFGAQGRTRAPGSYMVTVQSTEYSKYAFIAVDATLELGPKRILNFVGQLDDAKMAKLEQLQWSADDQIKVNGTIWFGHYPSSSMVSASPGFRQLAAKGTSMAYLCGHFHNLFGAVPQMYTKHHTGLIELELTDWKVNRMYRVGVIDQGVFSFADVAHGVWPVIVLTNPKPAFLAQSSRQYVDPILTSTHIRLLIFSPSTINECKVKIDNGPWMNCQLMGLNHPLYVVPWEPEEYAVGLHSLQVRARDRSGSVNEITHQFSLDGSRPLFPLLSRIALMIDLTSVFQVLFGLAVTACIVPLCLARLIHQAILRRQMVMHRFHSRFVRLWLRKFWLMANVNCLFYPFVCYTLYLVFGLWWIGELIDGNIAYVFAWGVVFQQDWKFFPGTQTYFYGFTQVLLFNMPLILILGYTADLSFTSVMSTSNRNQSSNSSVVSKPWLKQYVKHLPFILLMTVHLMLNIPFWIDNGIMSFFVSPSRTWSLFLGFYLWYKAKTLNSSQLMSVSKVWK